MPAFRYYAGLGLSYITRVTSGYYQLMDAQCGYTAIDLHKLSSVALGGVHRRYGWGNAFLSLLNVLISSTIVNSPSPRTI